MSCAHAQMETPSTCADDDPYEPEGGIGETQIGRGKISSLMPGHGGGISAIANKPERQAPSTTNSAVDKDTAVDKSGSLVAGQESMKAGKASAGVCHYNPWFQDASRSEVSKSLYPGLPMDTAPRANFSAVVAAVGVPSPVALGDGRTEEHGAGEAQGLEDEKAQKVLHGE